MHRRILASAAAAALTFGLAACGDEGEDGTVTTPPPSVSVGGSDGGGDAPSDDGSSTDGDGNDASDGGGDSTAAAPDIPAPDPADYPGMDQNTPEGAEQAARYYIALTMWGYQTGNTTELEAMHMPTCSTCQENISNINDLKSANEYWSPAKLTDVSISNETDSGEFDVIVGYGAELSEHTEPNLNSGGRNDVPALHFSFGIGMNWTDGKWVIADLFTQTEEA